MFQLDSRSPGEVEACKPDGDRSEAGEMALSSRKTKEKDRRRSLSYVEEPATESDTEMGGIYHAAAGDRRGCRLKWTKEHAWKACMFPGNHGNDYLAINSCHPSG